MSGKRLFRVAIAAAALLLGACATGPKAVSPSAPEATEPSAGTATAPVTSASGGRPPTSGGVSPTERLLEEAAEACAAGSIELGLSRLDRALRISPQQADLYLQMARCYDAAGESERAAAAAERGLAFCSGRECRSLRGFLK